MLQKSLFAFVCILLSLAPIVVRGQADPQYHQIAQIGRPSIEAIDWNPKQDLIAVASAQDIWLYDTQLQDVAHLDLAAAINLKEWTSESKVQPVNIWRIQEVKWSPDGKWLTIRISIYTADTIWQPDVWQIWSWDGSQFTQVMPDRFQYVSKITWNTNASQYAVLADGKVYLFDVANNDLLSSTVATDFAWNNEGTALALVKSNAVEILDAGTQKERISFSTDEIGVAQPTWSPDDTKLGVVNNNRLVIWDAETGERLAIFMNEVPNTWQNGSASPIFTMKRSAHKTPHRQAPTPQPNVPQIISSWAWLPDSKRIMILYQHPVFDQNLAVISDVETGKDIFQSQIFGLSLRQTLSLPQMNKFIALAFSMGGYPNAVVWNTTNWEILDHDFTDTNWMISPDKQFILGFGYFARSINIYDAMTLQNVYKFKLVTDTIRSVAWKADSQQFVVASADELQVWDLTKQRIVADNITHNGDITELIGWSSSENYFALSSQSSYPRLVDTCPSVRIWDVNDQKPLPNVRLPISVLSRSAWAAQTDQLLTAISPTYNCGTPSVSIWNPVDGKTLTLKNDLSLWEINWIGNDTLFTAFNGENWYVFDVKTGRIIRTVPLPKNTTHVEWIPKDKQLIVRTYSASDPQNFTDSLEFLDATTGDLLLALPNVETFKLAHDQTTIAVAYSSGGIEIASIGRNENKIVYKPIRQQTSTDFIFRTIDWNRVDSSVAIWGTTKPIDGQIQNEVLQIWSLENQEPKTLVNKSYLSLDSVTGFAWHPNSKTFAISQNGGIITIWSSEK